MPDTNYARLESSRTHESDQSSKPQPSSAEMRAGAVFSLAFMGTEFPQLKRAEVDARLELAAAILAWDDAEKAEDPNRHTLGEQAAVEQAMRAYTQALANLLRGDTAETETDDRR